MEKFFYRVKKGETLFGVCHKFPIPVMKVIKDNALKEEIREGDILYLEMDGKNTYMVEPMDDYESVSKKLCVDQNYLKEKNSLPYLFYGINIIY